jgi:hypothetical protein
VCAFEECTPRLEAHAHREAVRQAIVSDLDFLVLLHQGKRTKKKEIKSIFD